jgi:hypothetical protein
MQELREELREVLFRETRLLDSLIHSLSEPKEPYDADAAVIRDVIVLMIQALGVSIHSILRLTEHIDMSIRDCFGIARSASELAVNIGYITASPISVAERARQHAMQKSYRDLERTGSVGGASFKISRSKIPSPASIPGMQAALAAFTDKKGREIRDWTDENIDKRIETVAAHLSRDASLSLSGSVVSIYRHGSELLHGTYFGVVHYWTGSGSHGQGRAGFEKLWLNEHFITVFTATFFGAAGVVEACCARFKIPSLRELQMELVLRTKTLIDEVNGNAGE